MWRSRDAGETWEPLGDDATGCRTRFFVGVMRDAMSADDHDATGLYVGGRNGSVCGSFDGGATWRELVRDLPDVMVVRAARTA